MEKSISPDSQMPDKTGAGKQTFPPDETSESLLQGLLSKSMTVREESFNIVERMSIDHPERLYGDWNFFAQLLTSKNSFHKYEGLKILANLTAVDTENKFEALFETYFGILGDDKTMTAGHAALSAGTIARHNPSLIPRITAKLLDIGRVHRGKQVELVKAYVIEAFGMFVEDATDRQAILDFVRRQLKSDSPRTRKAAEAFLDRWDV